MKKQTKKNLKLYKKDYRTTVEKSQNALPLTSNTNWHDERATYWTRHIWQVVERPMKHSKAFPMFVATHEIDNLRKQRQTARKAAALYSQKNPGIIYDVILFSTDQFRYTGNHPKALDRSYLNGKRLVTEEVENV